MKDSFCRGKDVEREFLVAMSLNAANVHVATLPGHYAGTGFLNPKVKHHINHLRQQQQQRCSASASLPPLLLHLLSQLSTVANSFIASILNNMETSWVEHRA